MADIYVVDASPLIVLTKAGHLDFLGELADEILVPEPVVVEVLAGPASDPARAALEAGFGTRVPMANVPEMVTQWSLGPGESSVLAVTLQRAGCTAVLDDDEARKCARALGVPLVGTLGLALRAQNRGLISSLAQVVQDLRAVGLYVDEQLAADLVEATGDGGS